MTFTKQTKKNKININNKWSPRDNIINTNTNTNTITNTNTNTNTKLQKRKTQIKRILTQNPQNPHNTYLLPLYKLTNKHINQLADITKNKLIMKHIGKGNIWTKNDIKQFIKDEKTEHTKMHKNRLYYSYVLLTKNTNNNNVMGFISGRKNKSLLPVDSTPYDLLLRMFISATQANKGYGKQILKLFIDEITREYANKSSIPETVNLISDIDASNISSIKIHLANNFKFIDTIKYPNKRMYNRYKYILADNNSS